MSIFSSPPYNVDFRKLIAVKARAYNAYGWQPLYSPTNTSGVTVRRVPNQMASTSVVPADTTIT